MDIIRWIDSVLFGLPAIKAVTLISLVCALGLMLGKLRFKGISLGVAFVFFVGILAGSLGFEIDHDMLVYAEDFGLIIFVYVLGLQVGPGFVSAFRHGGASLSLITAGRRQIRQPLQRHSRNYRNSAIIQRAFPQHSRWPSRTPSAWWA